MSTNSRISSLGLEQLSLNSSSNFNISERLHSVLLFVSQMVQSVLLFGFGGSWVYLEQHTRRFPVILKEFLRLSVVSFISSLSVRSATGVNSPFLFFPPCFVMNSSLIIDVLPAHILISSSIPMTQLDFHWIAPGAKSPLFVSICVCVSSPRIHNTSEEE